MIVTAFDGKSWARVAVDGAYIDAIPIASAINGAMFDFILSSVPFHAAV
jgi:hypothetical protein